MNISKLQLEPCVDNNKWDTFVASSPQATIFCRSAFLAALDVTAARWLVRMGNVSVAGAIILKKPTGEIIPAPYSFALYQGVLFGEALAKKPHHRRIASRVSLLTWLLAELKQRYSTISFCLHPTLTDIRALQWFHYHEPDQGTFSIQVRYTGLINLAASDSFTSYVATIRKVRRQEYSHALAQGFTAEPSSDLDMFATLYEKTFARQQQQAGAHNVTMMRRIVQQAIANNFGHLLLCRDAAKRVLGGVVFLHDNQTAYYLFGATEPTARPTGSGTFLLLEHIRQAYEQGQQYIDMCGINSPQRGDYKTSFNAIPTPFFVTTWRQPT